MRRRRNWRRWRANFRAEVAVVADPARLPELREALAGSGVEAAGGPTLVEAAARGADITVAAIVGCAGLAPTMAAIEWARCRAGQQGSAGFGGRGDDCGGCAQRRDAAAGRFRAQRDLPVPAGNEPKRADGSR
jgi:hypothetical protein